MMVDKILEVRDLTVEYKVHGVGRRVLSDINFDLAPGEVLGIVGESGSGKSTLANALLRLLPQNGSITAGHIDLAGADIRSYSAAHMRRVRGDRIGMVFQDPVTSLNPTFTIGSQLRTAFEAHSDEGLSRREFRERAVTLLTKAGIPDAAKRLDQYPHEFSGGMRQRIMIVMMLLLKPQVIIADEPTSALDVTMQVQILELLRQMGHEQHSGMLFISHDLGVVSEIADRVMVLYAGKVAEMASAKEFFADPKHPYAHQLLGAVPSGGQRGHKLATIPGLVPSLSAMPDGCAFAARCAYAQDVCKEVAPPLFEVGSSVAACWRYSAADSGYQRDSPPLIGGQVLWDPQDGGRANVSESSAGLSALTPGHEGRAPLLSIRDLRVEFGGSAGRLLRASRAGVRAVDRVDLEVGSGEIVGLVGESGAGKSTLGRTLVGLVHNAAGEIQLDGQSLLPKPSRDQRRQIQMVFQDPHSSLSPRSTVEALLQEPYEIHQVPKSKRRSSKELLGLVELGPEHARKHPHELSGGQARRVGIARALALNPRLVVADEPTAGLDVSAASSVLNLLARLRLEEGIAMLLITHDLNVISYVADRVAVMYLGKIVEVLPADAMHAAAAHPYTRGLLAAVPDLGHHTHRGQRRLLPSGEIPSPKNPPSGCRYRTRCSLATDICAAEEPALTSVGAPGQAAACHHLDRVPREDRNFSSQVVPK
ncbi:ABC transporter ATP-binding protein [Paenarthrobacter sp. A20]|uniref:dipeptide ABC transporter ATP-binding protein n=1 Tax=Paenarthrobacter sp. A20 TaxID=2817891 RepID=UPI00209D5B16|nr:ABC transporter ATP-binding protein [Paenarthrobacter sp. A20]MCP1415614.1 peptide/nickel transport system ATP-binding protein [Paenarthrobacter sp. A20]